MMKKSKRYAAMTVSACIMISSVSGYAENISDNFTPITEEEIITEPTPTDNLYNLNLRYESDGIQYMSVNLFYLNQLSGLIPNSDAALDFISNEGTKNAKLTLKSDKNTVYPISSELDSFVAVQNYKIYIHGDQNNNAYVELINDSVLNDISSYEKTTVASEKFYSISDVVYDTVMHFSKGSSVKYYLNVEEEGWYSINLQKAGETLTYISADINGDVYEFDPNGSSAFVYLKQGINTLILTGQRSGSAISAISFMPVQCTFIYDESTKYVHIEGTGLKNSDVCAMLVSDTNENIVPGDISNLLQVRSDSDGNFRGEFKFTDSFENEKLIVNSGGIVWEIAAPDLVQSGETPNAVIKIAKDENKVRANVEMNNAIRGNNDECYIIIAFYDDGGKLVSINMSKSFAESFTSEIPAGAATANAFFWRDLSGIHPLSPSAGKIVLK